jgi:hypothetical protein
MKNFKLGNNCIIFTTIDKDGSVMSINTNRRIDVSDEVAIMESVEKVLNDMQKVLKYPRTWVGLDETEIISATCECIDAGEFNMSCAIDFARAIETKLKERNT